MAVDTQTQHKITIKETHSFRGAFPEVANYPDIDVQELYANDDVPFHVVLPIVKVGMTSANGLVYDEALVAEIESQLPGTVGIRGHVPKGEEDTAFPLPSVYWIGHTRVDETVWAKGYIPPGKDREMARSLKATNGKLSTSIYGTGKRVSAGNGTWKAESFQLESLDLAPHKRASLKLGGEFAITREIEQREDVNPMAENTAVITSVSDVPETIREQIIRDAKIQADAARVAELETQVSELAKYKSIVAEIRGTVGQDADIVTTFTEYHAAITRLAELMGVPYTNVTVRVEEMHEQIAEMKKREFENTLTERIAEFTNWNVKTDTGRKSLEALRSAFKRALVSELAGATDETKIQDVAARLWENEFRLIAETIKATLGGPSAALLPQKRDGGDDRAALETNEGRQAVKAKWGVS